MMLNLHTGLSAFLAALLSSAALATAQATNQASAEPGGAALAEAFARARPAVVHVAVEVRGSNTFRLERPASGVVVDPRGLILTWQRLVAEAADADKHLLVQASGADAEPIEAAIVATDDTTGLALLAVDTGVPWPALPLAATRGRPGEPVGVLSFHDGEDHVAFAGVATPSLGPVAVHASAGAPVLAADQVLLTDAAIQRRSHGGALISAAGELLGLCNAEHVVEEVREPTLEELTAPSFGFAIPSDVILAAFRAKLRSVARPPLPAVDRTTAALGAALRAVVAVHRDRGPTVPTVAADDPHGRSRQPGVGSGVVLDPSGLIATNAHLVDAASPLQVRTLDGRIYAARLIRSHPESNLALLAIDLPAGVSLPAIACADSDALVPGAALFGLGNPLGHTPTVSAGALSVQRGSALQTDARIGNENAGGALVDARGRLVGLLDGGRVDKVEQAFRRRGDRAKVDSGLNVTPSLRALRGIFADELKRLGGGNRSLFAPAAPTTDQRIAATVDRIDEAMLNIYIEQVVAGAGVSDNPFAPAVASTRTVSLGSGVVIEPRGLALTNWHVVDAATESDGSPRDDHVVRARTFDGRTYDVEVLSISREEDLALIRLELDAGATVPAVAFGRSEDVRVGDVAIALGNPEGRANSVTVGVVTAKNQAIRVKGRWAKLPKLLETDAAINGGNSGGALVDVEGRLIGINSAGGSAFNVTGYAIASDHVQERLEELLLGPHKMRSVYLGFRAHPGEGGLVVQSVDPTGPAARAGVARGDVLLGLAGSAPTSLVELAMIRRTLDTAATTLRVARDGSPVELGIEPLDREVWWAQRQLGVELTTTTIRDDADLIGTAATAFHRAFTGDPTSAPRMLPGSLLRVARIHDPLTTIGDGDGDVRLDTLAPGNLLLGIQLRRRIDGAETEQLIRFETPRDVRVAFQQHAAYEGRAFETWVWRDGAVVQLRIAARRLLP